MKSDQSQNLNDALNAFMKLPKEDYQSIIRSTRPDSMSYEDYKVHMKIYKMLTKGMLKGRWIPFSQHKESKDRNT